jgi:sugar (pentulose or hexulose) kinase
LLDDEPPQAIIMAGDSYEESFDQLAALGDQMAAAGIKVFAFLDGEDAYAADAFRKLAGRTGGRFARFGDALPLRDLCEGVSLLLAGGEAAVRRIVNENVKRLLLAGPSGRP